MDTVSHKEGCAPPPTPHMHKRRRARHPPATYEETCHRAWRSIHHPFLLPKWAKHRHEWEVYDMYMAGCTKCGEQHVCKPDSCKGARQELEDGSAVCTITGYLFPSLRTSRSEFSTCVTADAPLACSLDDKTADEHAEALHVLIHETLCGLIMSPEYGKQLELEHRKLTKRRTVVFNKRARQAKVAGGANMIDILAYTIHRTSNYRTPQFISEAEREEICKGCTGDIFRVFKLLGIHNEGGGWKRSIQRTKSLVVGLVYMTRMGVMWNDTVILRCIPIMRDILPQETCLPVIFGLRPKIITETENFVKMSIRSISPSAIAQYVEDQHTML